MVLVLVLSLTLLTTVGLYGYIRALVSPNAKREDEGFGFAMGYFIISIVMIAFEALLLVKPVLGFACAHWGWILGISLLMTVISCVVGGCYIDNGYEDLTQGVIHLILGLLIFLLMIFSLSAVRKTPEFEVSNAFEMRCLGNMPTVKNGKYLVKLGDDIDFKGENARVFGRYKNNYRFDGNGYTIKNIEFDMNLKDDDNAFFKMGSDSEIKNLTVSNCTFVLTPKNYDRKSKIGLECDYAIFGKHSIDMNNVVFENVVIYEKNAKANGNYSRLSTIGTIKTYGSDGITVEKAGN